MNVIMIVNRYVSLREDVYPRYSVMDPSDETWSGFKEHRLHLWIGFGIFGYVLHGIIGRIIDVIRANAEAIPE